MTVCTSITAILSCLAVACHIREGDFPKRVANRQTLLLLYLPRAVFSGGGQLDKDQTADLAATLQLPTKLRGNDPNALHNPCSQTVVVEDTVSRGRHC